MMTGTRAGEVIHFYNKISVTVVKLTEGVAIGNVLHFLGAHTDFRQTVKSMQVEHEEIESGAPGQEVAIKVKQRVRAGDSVFLLEE